MVGAGLCGGSSPPEGTPGRRETARTSAHDAAKEDEHVTLFRGRSGYYVAACQLCTERLRTQAVTRPAAEREILAAGWAERRARFQASDELSRWWCPACVGRSAGASS